MSDDSNEPFKEQETMITSQTNTSTSQPTTSSTTNSSSSCIQLDVVEPSANGPTNKPENVKEEKISLSKDIKSESHDDNQSIEKCPICLQQFSNSKSYASNCFHSFCFECLLEWTKIKYNCPLCKQPFDRIIFQMKSQLQYKEYPLKPKEITNGLYTPLEIIAYYPAVIQTREFMSRHLLNNINTTQSSQTSSTLSSSSSSMPTAAATATAAKVTLSKASWLVNKQKAPLEFRMLVYVNEWFVSSQQIQYYYKINSLDEEFNTGEIRLDADSSSSTSSNRPSSDVADSTDSLLCISYREVNSFRNTTPEWYQKNPACTHRLMNFLYRELKALAGAMSTSKLPNYLSQQTRSQLILNIISLIKKYDINSNLFLNSISESIKPLRLAIHFRHELSSFASSTCHDLIDYDAKCVYYNNLNKLKFNNHQNSRVKPLPLSTLPINLTKYKLYYKPDVISLDLNDEIETIQENRNVRHAAPALQSEIILDNETNETNRIIECTDSSDSEFSSYCEEVAPSPKHSPSYIVISSSPSPVYSRAISRSRSRFMSESRSISPRRSTISSILVGEPNLLPVSSNRRLSISSTSSSSSSSTERISRHSKKLKKKHSRKHSRHHHNQRHRHHHRSGSKDRLATPKRHKKSKKHKSSKSRSRKSHGSTTASHSRDISRSRSRSRKRTRTRTRSHSRIMFRMDSNRYDS